MIKYILLFLLASNFSAVIDNKYAIQYEKIKKTTFFEFSKNNIFKLASSVSMIIGGAVLGYFYIKRHNTLDLINRLFNLFNLLVAVTVVALGQNSRVLFGIPLLLIACIFLDKKKLINLGMLLVAVLGVFLGGYTIDEDYKLYKNILIHTALSDNLRNIITSGQSDEKQFLTTNKICEIAENIKSHNDVYSNYRIMERDPQITVFNTLWLQLIRLLSAKDDKSNKELEDVLKEEIIYDEENVTNIKNKTFQDLNGWKKKVNDQDSWNDQDLENREYKDIFNILYTSIFRIIIYSYNYELIVKEKIKKSYWNLAFAIESSNDYYTSWSNLSKSLDRHFRDIDKRKNEYLNKSYFNIKKYFIIYD